MEITGGQKRYGIVDYLKGFSILTIVFSHLVQSMDVSALLYKAVSLGGSGVHVFFLCSGFGLYLSQLRHPLSFPEFIKRKFFKIYIPYIAVVLVLACLPQSYDGTTGERILALMSHVFLFKMFVPSLVESFTIPLWYMSTLFQFYFAFCGLCLLRKKVGVKGFLGICIGLSVFWQVLMGILGAADIRVLGSFFLQYLWEFAIGMYAAERLNSGNSISVKMRYILFGAVLGIPIGGLLGLRGGSLKMFNDVFLATGYLCLALLVFEILPWYRRFSVWVSGFSFEWYLVHTTCYAFVFRCCLKSSAPGFFPAAAALGFSLITAIAYHTLLEKLRTLKRGVPQKNDVKH